MWDGVIISLSISKLLKPRGSLEEYSARPPRDEKARQAHDRLVKMGRKALPALREMNEQLIAEHQAYRARLKSGPSWNPLENYEQKSDDEKLELMIIEIKQARVVDVIKEIEGHSSRSV